ncbi:MAG: hypothetical protein AAGD88_05220 [Bacteroidota bacterium]
MKVFYLILILATILFPIKANATQVRVQKSGEGYKLIVDGKDFLIKGMNWDYFPIGTNYTYSLWEQPDSTIKEVLSSEMTMLKKIGVNTLRIYAGIPKKWIAYIYENYGIYTMLNHSFGRYGLTLGDELMENTEYDDPRVVELLLKETSQLAQEYKDTEGLLLYLLGNENNYSLFWKDDTTAPKTQKRKAPFLENRGMYKLFLLGKENSRRPTYQKGEEVSDFDIEVARRAKAMYSLFNEAAVAMKSKDAKHPIALCNGDIMFLETIRETCPDIDIFGTNMYRGISFGDSFQRVAEELEKPIMFTEFGADAYNVIEKREDQEAQAYYLIRNWKEIYANVAGIGGSKNAIGGFTFQFSDGWWKVDQYNNLDVHDTSATWNNGGYHKDYKIGVNNMNEEWFGICAKVPTNANEIQKLVPRKAYFVLGEIHKFSPYDTSSSLVQLENHFKNITITKGAK